ncbi:myosin light chain 3, skeletal muscle isoform-like [Anneissia japonica]|uniref:myosin light chain 3, skeletal muscle isoform-like n=1 Tax=Anneissia japonica TaxID=1529436 RepID=UPI0014255E2B|nr:myosin light chain 3, skeletal muscle isoform-like [Anneissia japonica]
MGSLPFNFYEDMKEEYRECFVLFDTVGDNKVSALVVGDIARSLGMNPTLADINKVIGKEADEDTRITFEDFLAQLQDLAKSKDQGVAEDYMECMRVFDKEGNGIITGAELRRILTSLGEKLKDEEVECLLAGLENSEGEISYEDFINRVIAPMPE